MQTSTLSLNRHSPETQRALREGIAHHAGKTHRVRAVDLLELGGGREEILFRVLEVPTNATTLAEKIGRLLITIRAVSLTATAVPCLAVFVEGVRRGNTWNAGTTLSALFGVVLLQVAINLYNDVSDYLKLIDLPGTPGGSGAFEKGWYTPNEILSAARICAVLGVLAGIPSLLGFPREILAIGLLGLAGCLLYSHERSGLKYHALGDLAVFVLCGPALTSGFSIAAFGTVLPSSVLIGLFLGLLACGLLHVNNLQDIAVDRARGAITLAGKIGYPASIRLLSVLYAAAFLTLLIGIARGLLPPFAATGFIAAIPALALVNRVRKALSPDSPTLANTRIDAAKIHLAAGILLSIGIGAAILWSTFHG